MNRLAVNGEKANGLMTDGRTDGRTDGQTDGRTDGRTDRAGYRSAFALKNSLLGRGMTN